MKNDIGWSGWLVVILVMIASMWLSYIIAESDLPMWFKFWLLS